MPSFDAPAEWFEGDLVYDEDPEFHFPVPNVDDAELEFQDALQAAFDEIPNEGFEVEDQYDGEISSLESDQDIYESPNTSSFEISDFEVSSESSEAVAEGRVNLADISDPTLVSSSSSPETCYYSNNGVFEDITNIEADQESIVTVETSIDDAKKLLENIFRTQDELEDKLNSLGNKLDKLMEGINENMANCEKLKFNLKCILNFQLKDN
ncbi:uncharacterized protein LOC108156128 [Drosophila miranda]|uniref:uncharacterized protein LOC108156128 n=1 Tax=Drosophila miranda TaxID=7229 RepID=UPI0007E62C50|nr:uncharacterized protein LOC108156128 [Drosophila miranda]